MVDTNRIEGTVKNAVGKGEEFLGKVGDRPDVQAQGIADQVVGTAQSLYGKTKDTLTSAANSLPDSFNDAADRGRDAFADAADRGRKAYKDGSDQLAARVSKQPLETLLLVGALGYLIGWASHRVAAR